METCAPLELLASIVENCFAEIFTLIVFERSLKKLGEDTVIEGFVPKLEPSVRVEPFSQRILSAIVELN